MSVRSIMQRAKLNMRRAISGVIRRHPWLPAFATLTGIFALTLALGFRPGVPQSLG